MTQKIAEWPDGGYDDGYRQCTCFWGTEPGSLVKELCGIVETFDGLSVLDAGCGEGKNAVFLGSRGAVVDAMDVSILALQNARKNWQNAPGVNWHRSDVRSAPLEPSSYDIVIAYGLLHCLSSSAEIRAVVNRLKWVTKPGGYHLICAFNDRFQDLIAHPNLSPTLVPHQFYIKLYDSWEIQSATDTDLLETHPDRRIPHTHSLTRLIVKAPE